MTLALLPDDVTAADQVVQLLRDNAGLRTALRRTVEERDYWRRRANRDDPEYQEAVGDAECHARQEPRS